MIVRIYALVDPFTLRIRYIGRTRCSLDKRLGEHVSKSRLNYNNTHKSNWIKSLLKVNSKPYIRLLCIVEGWEESHIIERRLISKYKDRLLNHDDRGEGTKNHVVTEDHRLTISETLKRKYKSGEIVNPASKRVYVYNSRGEYIGEYEDGRKASKELGIAYSAIYKCTSGATIQYAGLQFSHTKVESMSVIPRKPKVLHNQAV